MSNSPEQRFDRDLVSVTSDSGSAVNRVSLLASKRNRESKREQGRQSLRDKIGVERPPQTLREKIMATAKPAKPTPHFDVIAALRKRRAERERAEKIRHY